MRFLVAFALLRVRLAKNALRASAGRGAVGWLSIAAQGLAAIVIAALVLGGALGFSLLASLAGPALIEDGSRTPALFALRAALLLPIVTTLFLPFVSASMASVTAQTRLLLLPVPKGALHACEVVAALADPWLLAMLPPLAILAGSVAASAGAASGLLVLCAASLLAFTLAALSTTLGSVVNLALRDRRRAELVAVAVVTLLVGASLVPVLIAERVEQREAIRGESSEEEARLELSSEVPLERSSEVPLELSSEVPLELSSEVPLERSSEDANAARAEAVREWSERFPTWLQVLPSEAMAKVVAGATTPVEERADGLSSALEGLVALALQAGLAFTASSLAWSRLVGSPPSGSRRRGRRRAETRELSLPFVAPATAAVAGAFVRTSLRTVAGKLAFLMPLFVVVLLGWSGAVLPDVGGAGAGLLGGGLVLLGLQPFLLNVLAIDGAGLSRLVLAPLDPRTILRGKLIGGALLALGGAVLAIGAAALVRGWPGGALAVAAVVGTLGAYVPLAVAGAFLSIVLPKAVDPGRMGNKSQPHQGASLVGVLLMPFVLAPPVLLGVVSLRVIGSPWIALALELGWFLLVTLVAAPVLDVAAALLSRRLESVLLEARRP